jgi:large subunit ribosomal protein L9
MSNVKLILVESIHSLGDAGDLVSVKPGFARNYLLPQGKAILATESRMKELEHNKRIAEEKAARELQNLRLHQQKLESLAIQIGARAGEGGKLFGSVTAAQIAERIEAAGLEIDRRRIDLREPIKEVGAHKVAVKLHREVVAHVTVNVVADGGAASPEDEALVAEPNDLDRERRRGRRRDEDDDESDDEDAATR